jgi:chromosome segregation ATPase
VPQDYDVLDKLIKGLEADFKEEREHSLKLRSEIKLHRTWLAGTGKRLEGVLDLANKMEETRHEIKSQEQTNTRLERQIQALEKEIAILKKDALTEADIKPFKKLLK